MLQSCKTAFCSYNSNSYEVYCLKDTIQTNQIASYSVILSSAAYIVNKFRDLPHPLYPQNKLPHKRYDHQYPSPYMSVHPLFDQWVQILADSLFQGNALRDHNTLYIKVNVNKQYMEIIKSLDAQFKKYQHQPSVGQIFQINAVHSQKRVGWINCSGSQLHRHIFQPTMNVPGIVLGQIYNNQKYDIYNILKGDMPTVQQLMKYDTLIIPGSSLSVLSNVHEIEGLSKILQQAYLKSKKLKILGICYGHQLMSKIFGSKVVKRKRYGGIETIKFNKQIIHVFDFLQPLQKSEKTQLCLSQHHQDNVTTIPKGFIQLGVSNSSQNQALISENGRIFTFQFHPQYNYVFTKAFSCRMSIYHNNQMQDKPSCNHSKQTISHHLQSCRIIRECMMRFI